MHTFQTPSKPAQTLESYRSDVSDDIFEDNASITTINSTGNLESEFDAPMYQAPSESSSETTLHSVESYNENRGLKIQDINQKYQAPAGAITPVSREAALLPSYAQKRLWILAQSDAASYVHHMQTAFRLRGSLNHDALQRALNTVFTRHESLRSVFVTVDGQPEVQLLDPKSGLPMFTYDLRGELDVERCLQELRANEVRVPFDLITGPLIRAQLIQLAHDDHVFLLTQHHIVTDGWSTRLLIRELSALYTAYRNDQPDPLVPLTLQYPDYAAWQRKWLSGDRLREQCEFWRTALAGAPVSITLPTDRPRPSRQSFAGARMPVHVNSHTTFALKQLSQQNGVTLFMTLLAAWSVVLSRLSGQDDIVIGTPNANRNHHELEQLIGLFVNTLVQRVDLSGNPNVSELLRRIHQFSAAAQAHQDVPFDQVVEIMDQKSPLQLMFGWQNNEVGEMHLPGISVAPQGVSHGVATFDLSLELREDNDEIIGHLDYSTSIFDRSTIDRQIGYFLATLQAMFTDATQSIININLLSSSEQELLLQKWNTADEPYPNQLCIHQLFEDQVARSPDAIAIVSESQTLTYTQVNERANRLAHRLIDLGVKPDTLVALCVERSPAIVIGILAILKAGGAYLPLDPVYASERLNDIISDASPSILLADKHGRNTIGEESLASLTVIDPNAELEGCPSVNPQVSSLTLDNLIYIIYTSGSTGKPKGVMVKHAHVTRLFDTTAPWYQFNQKDVWCLSHSYSFDVSVWELWGALRYGGKLVVPSQNVIRSPEDMYRLICEQEITVLNMTPSSFKPLIGCQAQSELSDRLRFVILAGEALEPAILQPWYATRSEDSPKIVNMYGPTEITVYATYRVMKAQDCSQAVSPIGVRLPDLTTYILDAQGRPVPLGAVGELCIGGAGVTCGYLHRPELTAEKFPLDPFSKKQGARMYRTGDLVRYLSDGSIIFLGRNDDQVKIRGFRIELGEVEARLVDHPLVKEAAVLALGNGTDKRLVAYVVAEQSEGLAHLLHSHVAEKLPDYMTPTAYVRMDRLPLTANGKLDRRALPEPDRDSLVSQTYEAPVGETETALARIWEELLNIKQVGRHDNFFMLGGHSLLAVQLIERLHHNGLGLSIRALFETPTLSVLAQSLNLDPIAVAAAAEAPSNLIMPDTTQITPEMLPLIDLTQWEIDHIVNQVEGGVSNIQDIYALTPLQDGMLFHHIMATKGDPYLIYVIMNFDNKAILDRYLDAVQKVVDRHDVLRTGIMWEGLSNPAQVVLRHATPLVTELALNSADGPITEQLIRRIDPREHRIDLTQAPLTRFIIAQDADGRWVAAQLLHHTIGDHSTFEEMNHEIEAFLGGRGGLLPAPSSFRNLIAQTRAGPSVEEHEQFFTKMLSGIETPALPFGLSDVHGDGLNITENYRLLPQNLNNRLRSLAKSLGVSLASLCHLAWAGVVARTSGQQQVVFGTVLLGRMQAGSVIDRAMGLFINTLPIRIDMENSSVEDTLRQTQISLAALLEYEHASLAVAQQCSSVPAGIPLFSAVLNYRHNNKKLAETTKMEGVEFGHEQERTNYPFLMNVEDSGDSLGLTAQIIQSFDSAHINEYMQQALQNLADALEFTPKMPVNELEIMPVDERNLLLHSWNTTDEIYPDQLCIHHLFEQQVSRSPDAVAIVYESVTLTYAEVNACANRLAHHLIAVGVRPDTLVAICVERSPAMVVGLLAILKAGGAYVPLDPVYASERLGHILKDAAPIALLADAAGCAALGKAAIASLTVIDPNEVPDLPATNPHILDLTSEHLAYLIYTSGSTGTPKGVMIPHSGACNYLHWAVQTYAPKQGSVVSSSLSFDATVTSLWTPLLYGSTVTLLKSGDEMVALEAYVRQAQGEGLLKITPAHLDLMGRRLQADGAKTRVDTFVVGGEALSPSTVALWRSIQPGVRIVNEYGPTETVVGCSVYDMSTPLDQAINVPIGRPIANTRLYLLDSHGKPVPLGAVGELHIGGAGVARGYLNRPDLTAERFLPDPFSDKEGCRMYKTGDLARYLPDGNLEYLGRNDHQIKIRGFRIEPGEIEARLVDHPLVKEAAVLALGEGTEKRLVAYVVAEHKEGLAHLLRTHVAEKLPDYMTPAAFVRLDELPLTPNGKLDRRALPEPDSSSLVSQKYEAPVGEIEIALAAIWEELLSIERVGRHDNFFMLGGHSLLAVRLMNRVSVLGIQLQLTSLFASPILSDLANVITKQLSQEEQVFDSIMPVSRGAALMPSFAQQRLWFLAQMEDVSDIYHMPMALRLRGTLDRYALQGALNTIFSRHESLRSVFVTIEGQPQVQILSSDSGIPMRVLELQGKQDLDRYVRDLSVNEAHASFDLEQGPLIRAQLIQLAHDDHVFLLTQHHIVSDGWSMGLLTRELSDLYTAFHNGLPDPLAPLTLQYPDYAAWQRKWLSGDRLQEQSEFWRNALAGAPVSITLPTDRPRPSRQSFAGARMPIRVDSHTTLALKRLSQQNGATLFMTILAAWSAVLSRLSGQDDIMIGTPSANRNHRAIEQLIGFFVNTLVLRVDLSGNPSGLELLERVRQFAVAAQAHQDLPFDQVVEITKPPRRMDQTPLFQVMFAWQNNDEGEVHLPGIVMSPAEVTYDIVKFDLDLELYEENDEIIGHLGYSTALFEQSTIERHIGYLQTMLQAIATDAGQSVSSVNLLSSSEQELLLHTWSTTDKPYPDHLCIHHLFEEHVISSPDSVAVVYESQSLTYAEVNERANRLAHHLIELGVKPDSLVAICLERGPALVVGLLAILKAGGAYVPLDPSYASDRLRDIISDAQPGILIADTVGQTALGASVLSSVTLLDPHTYSDYPSTNPDVPELNSHHLAYVIYTSGSTGKPKGVMVEHEGFVNLIRTRPDVYGIRPSSQVMQFFSFSFDGGALETFMAIGLGASLHMLPDYIRLDRGLLWNYLERNSITQTILTPAVLQDCKALPPLTTSLTLVMAGEALPATLLRTLQRLIPNGRIINDYGPTEATVSAIAWKCPPNFSDDIVPIGRAITNKRVYLLDAFGQPVPLGAVGEMYIGGVGVARGYLNRPELTAQSFLADPFSDKEGCRMYKTGDLARYLPDGNLEYLGRNDHQIKIRGFRIEPGEIEARLVDHPLVKEAAVLALGEGTEKRLVAYVVAEHKEGLAHLLRTHVAEKLPDYMTPAAFVRLDELPLTPNGKLDRRALPEPDSGSLVSQKYEAPVGEIETALAAIWEELLNIERVGRHDNFFMLGGHSLLAVQLIERLRRVDLGLSVRALFETPTLSVLAESLNGDQVAITSTLAVPPNLIKPGTTTITPEMLPLINLTQNDIDHIANHVKGGVSNIQDIYALAPLQDGMLFHHIMATKGDPYLLYVIMAFDNITILDRYLNAVQKVVDRHDILRTGIMWEGLSSPAQVVLRQATLSVTELPLNPADGPIIEQLAKRVDPREHSIDLTQAPLTRFIIAQEGNGRWIAAQLLHHTIGDHSTLEEMNREIETFLKGPEETLPAPSSFRNLIAQTRKGPSVEAHERFFTEMLAEIETPALPFGLSDVHGNGGNITQSYRLLPQSLNNRLRSQAKSMGVSLATMCHLAWAQVIARTSGQQQVVLGTVLFGRMHAGSGADRAMGLFINTLPIRIDMKNASVQDTVHQTQTSLAALLEYEHASLALAQRCSNVPAGIPLFSALLNYRHNSTQLDTETTILEGVEFLQEQERTNYPFLMNVEDFGDSLGLTAQIVQPYDSNRIINYMQQALQSIADALEFTPMMPINELDVLPIDERNLVLDTWNITDGPYPDHLCVHQLFEEQVSRSPNAIAVVSESQTLTYAEVNERANRLAHHLIELGVKPDTLVALCVERSVAIVIGILAILKAGGAYLPLDPVYASERLNDIVSDASPSILLADEHGGNTIGEASLASLTVVDPNAQFEEHPATNPQVTSLTSHHLAYVIYTSGSTGKPKGVMVEHAQVTRLFDATAAWYQFNENDVWCLLHSYSFDFSVWELWGALRYGGKLVLPSHHVTRSSEDLYELICEQGITVLNLTPSAFKPLIACHAQSELQDQLRYVIFGGEALEPAILQPWYATRSEHSPKIVNMYGITETTVHVTYRVMKKTDCTQAISPIGARIPDLTTYILDTRGNPVPMGVVGELYIGGAGVTRGYLNRPELTAERFPLDPFSKTPGARMYRTGDLGRYQSDGSLIFLGRNDHQVKIRGFRIELGEIEARLVDHPLVKEAAVLAVGDDSDKRLVAYVVAAHEEELAHLLRSHVAEKLPDYMTPAAFVRMDKFPLTANGKLDRRALPEPDSDSLVSQKYEAPVGEIETALASIWEEQLNVTRVGRHDNYFMLGGHSLLAVQLIERLRRIGLGLSIRALFDTPTLSVLAQSINHDNVAVAAAAATPSNLINPDTTEIFPAMLPLIDLTQSDIDHIVNQVEGGVSNIQDIYALAPLQDGMLFHHIMSTKGDPYLLISAIAFDSRAVLNEYLSAVQKVIDRHDILRTSIMWEGLSTPAQVVLRHATLSFTELSLNSSDGPIVEQLKQRFDPREHRMDLTRAPLLRYVAAQDDDGRWIVIELMHHIIDDNTSVQLMYMEIQAFMDGEGDSLPSPQPFRNLIAQARAGPNVEAHERFFTQMLGEIDTPALPFGLSDVHGEGLDITETQLWLPQDLNKRLRSQARSMGVSLASLCHLAWAQVIARTSGQQQVVFGTVLFGRMNAGSGLKSTMGPFINTLPLRIGMDASSILDTVRKTHATLAALMEHEYASLTLAQRCSSVPSGTPMFSALLNYRHNMQVSNEDTRIAGIEHLEGQERTNYPFVMSVEDFGDTLGVTAQVVQPYDSVRIAEYMKQALQNLASALECSPTMAAQELEVLAIEERNLLLHLWNTADEAYPNQLCIHQLFEDQVVRSPDAIAIVSESQTLTYTQVNERANRLAHRLIDLGVKPDTLVALCVERSPAIVIGILAIMKAGGAYLPLDPVYASERLNDIISDASPSILLADKHGRNTIGEESLASLTVIDPNAELESCPSANPQVSSLTLDNLIYIIYTSGSTGKPKGVMVKHAHVTRLFDTTAPWYQFNQKDVWCLSHSYSFDVSVWELWGALRYGGKLVVPSQNVIRSPEDMYRLICEQEITVLNMTPSSFKPLIGCQAQSELSDRLRFVILAGEALEPAILQPWYATRSEDSPKIVNMYGPTEITVYATYRVMKAQDCSQAVSPIGVRLPDLTTYILDAQGRPVPLGAVGELCIGGAGVTCGYLHRPELTAEKFPLDPFSKKQGARMYRTGDLVRYLSDGSIIFLGRNDDQVKIRGFRIELGEVEARLVDHPLVKEAAVLALGNGTDKRLVAYVVAEQSEGLAHLLHSHVAEKLPDYMTPTAYVRMDRLPLTANGKLDRRALPEPDRDSLVSQTYEAPVGETETALARIWEELLNIKQVGRHDNFFMLGGHSLLAVQLIERLRRIGLGLSVRALFDTPTLSVIAQSLNRDRVAVAASAVAPPNLITPDTTEITPEMLPLIDLTQDDIDHIVNQVEGGVSNIQDIYALAPLQDGMLFHHIMLTKGDPYVINVIMAFDNRAILDRYLDAVQKVVDRHDILRTGIMWEGLSTPAQVVLRHATLSVTELVLNPADGSIVEQLTKRVDPREHRIDLTQAPLTRFITAQDIDGRWVAAQLLHHTIGDHSTLEEMNYEIESFLGGRGETLPVPSPFRNLIAQARAGPGVEEQERFFTKMLGEIDTPALPFGLTDVHGNGFNLTDCYISLPQDLNDSLRNHAKKLGVSLASMCHLAWAQVISRTSGQQRVVFGTVLFGRMQAGSGADHAMGLFINTLPIRIDMENISVQESILQTQASLAALMDHEHASLALAQRCSSVPSGTPMFSALLNYRHNKQVAGGDAKIDGIEYLDGQERTNYPFTMSVEDGGVSLGLTAQAVRPYDSSRICNYMQQALQSLDEALNHAPNTSVGDLEILPTDERHLLIQSWNDTDKPCPHHIRVHQLFENQVDQTPDAIAVVYRDQALTFRELNARANWYAQQLKALGIQPGDFIATLLKRSTELIVMQIAILKVGAAYVPIDPKAPADRQAFIIDDCAARLLVTTENTQIPSVLNTPLLRLSDNPDSTDIIIDAPNVISSGSSVAIAYAMYTSGSTGIPKGVLVPHRAIVRLTINNGYANVGPDDRVAFAANPAFDASTFEIWAPLLNGGQVVIIDADTFTDSVLMAEAIDRHHITTLFLTTVLFNQFVLSMGSTLAKLRYLLCGGEQESLESFATLLKYGGPEHLIHCYGPTETTTFATTYEVTSIDHIQGRLPIGRPISKTSVYVLDQHGHPVPLGVVGELYIGGTGVANGYLNRADLSAERFLPDPFSTCEGNRMYRTGDLVRFLPDGNLVFVSRNDHQVKIRGFRIELGEIEARLIEHPLVNEVAVLAIGNGADKRLVAYVVAEQSEGLAHLLHSHVAEKLPDYMTPTAYVRMDRLPLTANGKLDRRALPEPDRDSLVSQTYEAPVGETETALARIWEELLNIKQVGRHDNFFMLGGHSLLAVQLIERLRRIGLGLSVRALFDTPTLSVIAQSLNRDRVAVAASAVAPPNLITPDTTEITPEMLPLIDLTQDDIDHIVNQVEGGVSNIQDIYALAPLQDGMLFHHIMATKGDPYLIFGIMAFADKHILTRYLDAVQKVVDRHDILRTGIMWEGLSTPAQVVLRHATLSVTELVLNPADGSIVEQLTKRVDPREHRIDLTQAPLTRFITAQDIDGRWIAAHLLHHAIGDHSAADEMNHEIEAILDGRADLLPAPSSFRNLIAQARVGHSVEAHERFFTEMLSEIETPALPFGLSDVHGNGHNITEAYCLLPQGLNNRLRSQAKSMGVSLASICHLAWAQVIARTSGQQQVVFGTVLFGRMQAGSGADRAMGLYINTLPIRIDVDNASVQDTVRQTQASLAALMDHEHASLALAQRCSSVPSGIPMFSALLNYRHNKQEPTNDTGIPGIEYIEGQERTNYPFLMSVEDNGTSLGVTAQIVQPYDSNRIINYMQQALQSIADALEFTPMMPINELDVLPIDERNLVLDTWNITDGPYPDHLCVHQLFEEQVSRSPNAIAVVSESQTLTYSEVNERANRLAHHLIELGVKPDTLVALCVERSVAIVIGILAILKAGGAYLPLDPVYASERLNDIVSDASPSILLADEHVRRTPATNPQVTSLTSHHLAYVIYTSGSTGKPKGVMVEHAQVTRLFDATAAWYQFNENDVWCLLHSYSFDFSVWELWGALRYGAPFKPLIACHAQSELQDQLRYVIFGGEALEPAILQPWYATRSEHSPKIVNMYGITETTVHVTYRVMKKTDCTQVISPIGSRIPDLTTYILDTRGNPVPMGVVGELYIGGAGVTRGYLNRPELTAERFPLDPFSKTPGARMYRTGDLGRYQSDGSLIFLVIRGFRIELGEIEARLVDHPLVKEAAVLAVGDDSDKRLVAYVVAAHEEELAHLLRSHVAEKLPDYMIPTAFVRMDKLPLTANGKLDRRALPEPDSDSLVSQKYEAPVGEIETALAAIWEELLQINRVGRHDNFFMLGGHSLLAVQLIERLRRIGLVLPIRALFNTPTLSILAQSLNCDRISVAAASMIPPNLIKHETTEITPEMLPLIDLTQSDIDRIVSQVEGGVSNIQDIYALAPLQDGMLFHHIMSTKGDPYLLISALAFDSRAVLDRYLGAVQKVVVLRHATLSFTELSLNSSDGSIVEQLKQRFDPREHSIDLTQAPLLRYVAAQDDDGRWIVIQLMHHIIDDNTSVQLMYMEIQAFMDGEGDSLPSPQPFRNLIAQARAGPN
ncbi:amino acid adenylation enzyme/thioester reductase family protein, partial [Basidiobolus meristosporus CBS 931.73]